PRFQDVRVLAIVHGSKARSGVFGEVTAKRGHTLDEWSLTWRSPPPQPVDAYGAVFIFGGSMHADQDHRHPWLREETFFIQRLLGRALPERRLHSGLPARRDGVGHPVPRRGNRRADPLLVQGGT